MNNFFLHLRLSQKKANSGRWNAEFIRREIGKLGCKNVQKVWVCGPPSMNEYFDKVLSGYDMADSTEVGNNTANFQLSPEQYEIL